MNNLQLYIPKKCKVGFNLRPDTYTGKLGYIIYHDGKVWRKEKSWDSWCKKPGDSKNEWDPKTRQNTASVYGDEVAPIEFENVPTEGFVLNKKVGGTSSGWDHRQTYSRVYDPRGWEFEITVPNLLYILQECSSFKGKGLEGAFVYSWEGKDLVLLPATSPDYIACTEYTDLQSKKVGKRDLTLGCLYLTSKQEKLVYIGHYNVCVDTYNNKTTIERHDDPCRVSFTSMYVFRHTSPLINTYSGEEIEGVRYEFLNGFGRLKMKLTEVADENFAGYVDEYEHSEFASLADHLEVGSFTDKFWNYISWNTEIFILGDIKNIHDYNDLKRIIKDSEKEKGKYDIFKVEERSNYGYSSYNRPKPIPIETLTKEQVEAKYGDLIRVYKNGFKKVV
jgi:hypothetical protein